MKKYTCWEDTPLKYHYFNTYIRNPLWIISSIYTIIQTNTLIRQESISPGLIAIDLIYAFLAISVSAVCMVGFIKRNKYGWYAHMYRDGMLLIYYFILLMLSISWNYEIAYTFGEFLGVGTFAVLEAVYYLKRKSLFVMENNKNNISLERKTLVTQIQTDVITHNDGTFNIVYCRKCGNKLLPDSDFCSYCGTKVVKES